MIVVTSKKEGKKIGDFKFIFDISLKNVKEKINIYSLGVKDMYLLYYLL